MCWARLELEEGDCVVGGQLVPGWLGSTEPVFGEAGSVDVGCGDVGPGFGFEESAGCDFDLRERCLLLCEACDLGLESVHPRVGVAPVPGEAVGIVGRERAHVSHWLDERRIGRCEEAEAELHRRGEVDEPAGLDELEQVEEMVR